MDSVDIEVLRSAQAWMAAGHRVTLATIVKTWGSAPRPVGALLVIREDGLVSGSVSGGCVEDDLIEKVKSGGVAKDKPAVTTYGITNEEANRWGLPCGGTLQLVLEPLSAASGIAELLETIGKQQLVSRRLEIDTGKVTLTSVVPRSNSLTSSSSSSFLMATESVGCDTKQASAALPKCRSRASATMYLSSVRVMRAV